MLTVVIKLKKRATQVTLNGEVHAGIDSAYPARFHKQKK